MNAKQQQQTIQRNVDGDTFESMIVAMDRVIDESRLARSPDPLIRLGPGGEYTKDITPDPVDRPRCRYGDEWRDENPVAVARMALIAATGVVGMLVGVLLGWLC